MAKKKPETKPEEANGAEGEMPQGPMLQVLAQYTKDASFEKMLKKFSRLYSLSAHGFYSHLRAKLWQR